MVERSRTVAKKESNRCFELDQTLVESEQAVAPNVIFGAHTLRALADVPRLKQRNRRESRFLPAADCGAW